MDDTNSKQINITGTNNKYKIKNLINSGGENNENIEKKRKKRIPAEKWCFSNEQISYENQIKMIIDISNNHFNSTDDISKIAIREINKKISSYKQQDKLKKMLTESKFLTFESVINKMLECELKCRYCKNEMNVLYDISREMRQWSVDRVDNDIGHNIDNFHLACLDCNLKRRRRTDEKFLFTKQLNIIKMNN
jgi:hypothetical protein